MSSLINFRSFGPPQRRAHCLERGSHTQFHWVKSEAVGSLSRLAPRSAQSRGAFSASVNNCHVGPPGAFGELRSADWYAPLLIARQKSVVKQIPALSPDTHHHHQRRSSGSGRDEQDSRIMRRQSLSLAFCNSERQPQGHRQPCTSRLPYACWKYSR